MTPTPGALATRPQPTQRPVPREEQVLTDWCCDNCEAHNPGRRRRCWDCRTTRY